jgi:hypothetical protein
MGGLFGSGSSSSPLGLTPQNGYQANNPLNTGALNQQMANSQQGFGQNQANQTQLAQALLAQSQGQGPNPALNQMNQANNQNIQQNAGMIASQKGISPALATQLASQNQGNMSQQNAANAATMSSQQQLGAQQQLGNVYAQQAGENLQNSNQSGQLINSDINGTNQINAGVAAQNTAANQSTTSGILGGLGGFGASAMGLARGGMVQKFAGGGAVGSGASAAIAQQMLQAAGVPLWGSGVSYQSGSGGTPGMPQGSDGSQSVAGGAGDSTGMPGGGGSMMQSGGMGGALEGTGGAADVALLASKGGTIPHYDSGGAVGGLMKLAPLAMMLMSDGGKVPPHIHAVAKIYHPNFQAKGTEVLKAKGGNVPGKAKVPGDSPENDTVKTMLSPGEVVIPRSVMNSKDPAQGAHDFVAMELAKRGKGNPQADFKGALKQAISSRKGK